MYLGLSLSLGATGVLGVPSPGLTYGALSLDENSAQGTAIAALTITNASNPGSITLTSSTPSGAVQVVGLGVDPVADSGASPHDDGPDRRAVITPVFHLRQPVIGKRGAADLHPVGEFCARHVRPAP